MSLPLSIGDVVAGKYRLDAIIGEGGMGTVARATHLLLHEPVAIKFLSRELTHREDLVERFFREARAAIRIKSEHVARVMDVGLLDTGEPYLVLELLEGRDLEAELTRLGVLPIHQAVEYVLQACDAIAEAHELGIVHRDLKPANLFLTRKRNGAACVKVLDFGIAKMEGGASKTKTSAIMGSPAYMSPEQVRATRDVDARSDLWSLGAVLFELLTGAPPFDGESAADVTANILRNEPPMPSSRRSDLPPELEEVVLKCLAKSPDDRFGTARELALMLSPFSAPETRRVLPLGETAPPPESRSSAATPTGASSASIASASVASTVRSNQERASDAIKKLGTDATVAIESRPRERSSKLWLGLGLIAALAAGGFFVVRASNPRGENSAVRVASGQEPTSRAREPSGESKPRVVAVTGTPSEPPAHASAAPTPSLEPVASASASHASPPAGVKSRAPTAPTASSIVTSAPTTVAPPVSTFGGRK